MAASQADHTMIGTYLTRFQMSSCAAFFRFDLRLGRNLRPVRKWEQFQVSPQINIYNLFNHQNYDSPSLSLGGTLNGAPGLNGTTARPGRLPLARSSSAPVSSSSAHGRSPLKALKASL